MAPRLRGPTHRSCPRVARAGGDGPWCGVQRLRVVRAVPDGPSSAGATLTGYDHLVSADGPRNKNDKPRPVVDLFAGLGGWDHGARILGLDPVGVELDDDACRSRALSNIPTIQADIATYAPERFAGVDGLIASPPCQSFSRAGSRRGLNDERGQLVYEPLRWATALRPRWIACEQVPDVEPIWREIAHHLREVGYRTWVGVLSSEQFGVPQTRQRAILMAHRDRGVHPPTPTHQRFVKGEPARRVDGGMFEPDLLPWVSAGEALGAAAGARLGFPRRDDRGDSPDGYRERDWRESTEPAFTLTEKARSTTWTLTDRQDHGAERSTEEPAPTITAWLYNGNKRWTLHTRGGYDGDEVTRGDDEPAVTMTGKSGTQWRWMPATTVMCDPRLAARGHHDRQMNNSVALSLDEGLILQGFPAGLPMHGTMTSRWRQVGNAIPPPLATAILGELIR